jgi:OOP family OmpA-OmpF porin
MRVYLATTCILAGSLLAGGCATKKYVRNTTAPIQAKVDQVGTQTTQNTQQIEDTKGQLKQVDDKAQSGINAAQERASAADQHAATADQHASDAACYQAKQATQMADANSRDLNKLRACRCQYRRLQDANCGHRAVRVRQVGSDASAKEDLDKLAGLSSGKRFVISVEGFTDSVGDRAYNEALSRKRADAVVTYLVAKHDMPIYRIHMIGLGEEKPVDEGKDRAARAKNRRVEVKVFTADTDSGTATTASRQEQQ